MINIPTLAQLYNSVLADLEAEFNFTIPLLGKNFLRAVAAVQAAKLKLIYLSIGNVQRNMFVDTAQPEAVGGTLERFGRVKLNRNPFPARAGQYEIEVTGSISAVIPALTTFKSNDDSVNPGKLYILDTPFTLTNTVDYITVRALDAGVDSKLEIGNQLTATAPIIGVNSLATVSDELIEPLVSESIEDYRTKAVEAYRLEPQGGAGSDYRLWAFDTQGVKQVYPYAKSGAPGQIDLFVEANKDDSIDGKGTPSALLLQEVADNIEFDPDSTTSTLQRGRRPLGTNSVNYLPIVLKTVYINIDSFQGWTPAIGFQLNIALKAEIEKIRPFVASVDILAERNDYIDINKINFMILNALPGSKYGAISLEVDSVPVTSYTFDQGEIPDVLDANFS